MRFPMTYNVLEYFYHRNTKAHSYENLRRHFYKASKKDWNELDDIAATELLIEKIIPIVIDLEKAGFIERKSDIDYPRLRIQFQLTENGHDRYNELRESLNKIVEESLQIS